MRNIGIALLGFGTVGSGVAEAIARNKELLRRQLGCEVQIRHVLVRHPEAYANRPLLRDIPVTNTFSDIITDAAVDIVVEVMGGIHPALEYINEAIAQKKSVVSANKDLVAMYGPDIISNALSNHVHFSCEASVAGGIPILMPLHQSLAANEIESIVGILNGTTNYILTRMYESGASYESALKEAQDKGFAEADPTNDVCGYDAARKLAILASIGFRANVTLDDVIVEGIERITQYDIQYARDMGYTIKLLAVGTRQKQGVSLNVYPAFVPLAHPLASISGAYNAVYVVGNIVGDVMFYGQGAGSLPTASAVMGDVISTAQHIMDGSTGSGLIMSDTMRIPFYSSLKLKDSYYFRMLVDDVPGVLAQIAAAFADNHISIKEAVQKNRFSDSAELMLITEQAPRENIIQVEKALAVLPCVRNVAGVIRVLDDRR